MTRHAAMPSTSVPVHEPAHEPACVPEPRYGATVGTLVGLGEDVAPVVEFEGHGGQAVALRVVDGLV